MNWLRQRTWLSPPFAPLARLNRQCVCKTFRTRGKKTRQGEKARRHRTYHAFATP